MPPRDSFKINLLCVACPGNQPARKPQWSRKPERTQAASERKLWVWEQLLVWLNVPGQPLLCVRWKHWRRWRLKARYCTLTAWVTLAGQGKKGERKILPALLAWHLEGAGIHWWTPWGTSTWEVYQFTFPALEWTHLLRDPHLKPFKRMSFEWVWVFHLGVMFRSHCSVSISANAVA